jgi:EAL domain-containing protein (putative c-di-GMP-specific phosphodiesterase class I)/GGDEF domain-containing protein
MTVPALPASWMRAVDVLDHAFQPIVNVHSGICYGYEALLRNVAEAGYPSITALFDRAFEEGILHPLEGALSARTIRKFARLPHHRNVKLFCNADSRGAILSAAERASLIGSLEEHGLSPSGFCMELSERHNINGHWTASEIRDSLVRDGFGLAVDDFGRGFSGLELLYSWHSDFVKIDRFFFAAIDQDPQKRVLTETIVKLVHQLGRFVVAEGIETEAEFHVARDIGCDLIQGHLIQRPTLALADLTARYESVAALVGRERRGRAADPDGIAAHAEMAPTIPADQSLFEVLETFGRLRDRNFLVVVDLDERPLGIIREQDLKHYLYNPFGRDLLSNASFRKPLTAVISRCPVVDINAPLEKFIEMYARDEGKEGVIVLRDMKYAGFLDSRTLLNVVSEHNLAAARDQNPLTRLPGNQRIYEYVSRALGDTARPYIFVYFDFDWFKPFNDVFGFRQGDRALILFAEMLVKAFAGQTHFVGHIGGGDFFAGARDVPFDATCTRVRRLLRKFRRDIESFYDAESRERGHIVTSDRDGTMRQFPLMSVSAVALCLPPGRLAAPLDRVSEVIVDGKRAVKRDAPGGLHVLTIAEGSSGNIQPFRNPTPRLSA